MNRLFSGAICIAMFSATLTSCDKSDNPTPQATEVANQKPLLKQEVEDRPKTVKGKIKTVHSHAVANATVLMYLNGDTLVGTATSDSSGNYEFNNITGGNYQLKYAASGYQDLSDWETIPFNDESELVLADIVMLSE